MTVDRGEEGRGHRLRREGHDRSRSGGDEHVLEADKFLAAFGFAPRVEGYGLENIGVKVSERGAIEIDDYMPHNVENVYAIGDCTPGS
jgi:dihydrolipoamide dehydrogenase